MKALRIERTNLIPLVFIILPFFIDQIDGFIFQEFNRDLPISKIYKTPLLLFAMAFVFIYSRDRPFRIWLSVFFLFLLISQAVNLYFVHLPLGPLLTDFGHILKIFTFPILYFFLMTYYRKRPLPTFLSIRKLYNFLFICFCIAIVLSYFGFGIPFYGYTKSGESIGQQGYFISGNAISAFFLLISCLFYYYIVRSHRFWLLFSGGALSIMIGLLMGSKTAILSSIICFVGVYVAVKYYERKILHMNRSDALFLVTVVGFVVGGVVFFDEILNTISPIYRNYSYRYRMSDTFLEFLTSGRVYRAEFELGYYAHRLPFLQMLFGRGYTDYHSVGVPNTKFSSSEIDFIDILHIAGFFGVILIYGFWIFMWYRVLKQFLSRKHPINIPLLVGLSVLLLNSNMSGHIIHSALLNLNLAFLCVFALQVNEKEKPSPAITNLTGKAAPA